MSEMWGSERNEPGRTRRREPYVILSVRGHYQTMKFPRRCGTVHVGVASVLSLAVLAVAPVGAQGTPAGSSPVSGALKYPATLRGSQVDELAGPRVPDPYRWLENVTAPEVRSWVT